MRFYHSIKKNNKDRYNTIVVRGTNWIGDTIMTIPAYRELRRLLPKARIVAVVKKVVSGLYKFIPEIDEIIDYGDRKNILCLGNTLKKYEADVFLCFQNAFEAAFLSCLSRAPLRIGYARDARSWLLNKAVELKEELFKCHQVYYYLELLHGAGLSDYSYIKNKKFSPDISIVPPIEIIEGAKKRLKSEGVKDSSRFITVHAGASYGPAKRWPASFYSKFIRLLKKERSYSVILVGSRKEYQLAELIKEEASFKKVYNFCGKTTLEELVGIIAGSALFVSNDSGPMHIASALGVKQVAIFGSTDPVATGPFSKNAIILKKPVDCSPCFKRVCPFDLKCFKMITPEEVFEVVRGII